MKKGNNNWGYNIQWMDDNLYSHLPSFEKKKLNKLRSLDTYIKKLQGTIDEHSQIIDKLKTEINKRKKKITKYKNEGKEIFQYIEKLKSEFEVRVYYTEGKQTKGTKKIWENQKTGSKEYKQINLKYKTKGGNLKTISLGTTRGLLLSEIKKVNSSWYSKVGHKLEKPKELPIKDVKREMSLLFTPIIEKTLKKYYKKIVDNNFKLTKEILLKEMSN